MHKTIKLVFEGFSYLVIICSFWPGAYSSAFAGDDSQVPSMDNLRLQSLIEQFDQDYQGQPGSWKFQIDDTIAAVLTDEQADRMRIMVQVTLADNLEKDLLYRMLQANFDTALDARYAIANGRVFSTFIHPLSELSDRQFISGVAQTVALANSFGDNYSSGVLRFEGGDSAATERELYDRIIELFRSRSQSI